MSALLVSTGAIAIAEIGDKTQLLAFLLASRFKKPIPIILGILLATIINHGLAGWVGHWVSGFIRYDWLQFALAASFFAMAIWVLIPDSMESQDFKLAQKIGIFGATFVAFFLAEMGDKTQLATIALTAHYADAISVVIGTTLGMLIADVPAVFAGNKMTHRIPVKWIHRIAALLFFILGLVALGSAGLSETLF